MAASDVLAIATLLEALRREHPDRGQQPEPSPEGGRCGLHEAVVDQRRDALQDFRHRAPRVGRRRPRPRARRSCRRRPTAARAASVPDLAGGRSSRRLRPGASVAARAHRVSLRRAGRDGAEPLGDVARREERHPRCRDLDPQREPVEAAADLRHGVHVLGREAIAGPNARCPILEQADRIVGSRVVDRQPGRRTPSGGTGNSCSPATRSGARLVATIVSSGAARSRPGSSGAASRTCSTLSMTTASERDARNRLSRSVDRFRTAARHEAERCGEDAQDEVRVTDRLQRDEPRAVPKST